MGVNPLNTLPATYRIPSEFVNEPIKGALGGLPVAEQTQNYFVVFKQVGGTGPEIIGETAYFITYLVDSQGNVSKPAEDGDALNNLVQNFPVGRNCIVRQDAASSLNSILAGKQKINAIGRQLPILYTQTGFSTGSWSSAISFSLADGGTNNINPDSELLDYRGNMTKQSAVVGITAGNITGYDSVTFTPDASAAVFNTTNGTYIITPDTELTSLTFKISFKVTNTFGFTNVLGQDFKLALKVDNDNTGYSELATKTFFVPSEESIIESFEFKVGGFTLTNDGINPKFIISSLTTSSALKLEWINFQVYSQNPPPQIPSSPASSYWSTGTASPSGQWLTASSYISMNYGNTQISSFITEEAENGFNLSPIVTPFTPQVGDRIRFEYNKAKDYYIYEVIPPSEDTQNKLKIRINDFVPTGTILNNFILHRTDLKDPAYIILDVDKDDSVENTQDFNGIILPEYPSEELLKNLDKIIVTLKKDGIIADVQS
jgi:hypothetical protein